MLVEGSAALDIILNSGQAEGYESWRRLVLEYDLRSKNMTDESLRDHLVLQRKRLTTSAMVRDEVMDVVQARATEYMRKATAAGRAFVDKSKKVSAMLTTDETPPVATVTLAPDFDGYLFAVTMDSSWKETLCPLTRPTALARLLANATPMSRGRSVFQWIGSGCVWTSPSEKRNSCASRPQVARTCCSSLLDTGAQGSMFKCAMIDSRLCLFTV